ncbi:MAG TPA: cytochrome P450 [Jatrophihabitans sp.]|nr:cytochrome P450 [Jatrophihabitans sp.]
MQTDLTVDLKATALFRDNAFWPVLAWLRANDPVHWHPEPDGPGFWVVTRYHDVVEVYTQHEIFSSRYGMRLDSSPAAVSAVSQRMLIVSDPPSHTELKRVLSRPFGQAEMPRLEMLVRQVVRDVLDGVVGDDLEFLDVAKRIPNYVVCALMGLPRADWDWVGRITTEAFEGSDDARSAAHGEIFLYFSELLDERRVHPGDDFVSRVAHDHADRNGVERSLTDEEIIFNCNGVLAGANETTRYSAAGGVLAFVEHPTQWRLLVEAGEGGVAPAVEEILRWTVPGMHAMRTAMRPVRLNGVRIAAGDRVTIWNGSANRDEAVFQRPDEFNVGRAPNRHLTFGTGRHLCLGSRLARLELTVFLSEFIKRVDRIEPTGAPRFNASNFTWGLRRLPVRLVPRQRK